MTVARVLALLGVFAGVAVWCVHLRAEQTRLSARIQALRAEQLELRREAWTLELEAARLKSPEQIRVRADRWHLDVYPRRLELIDLQSSRLVAR